MVLANTTVSDVFGIAVNFPLTIVVYRGSLSVSEKRGSRSA